MAASLSARPQRYFLQVLAGRRFISASHSQLQTAPNPVSNVENYSDAAKSEHIVVPRKKKRDELTVLRALASTVTRDANAPHYKYTDDPFLIPTSHQEKRSHALSKEAGKKAARYILENYSQWFNTNPAEPSIEAFMPPALGYTRTEASEAALLERIERRKVKDAIEVYKKIKQGKSELSQDACRKFLELLCVFNSQDPPASLLPEESYLQRDFGAFETSRVPKTWKDDGMADRVYDELEEKTVEDQQNLIRGMARYLQTEKAFMMYDELIEKKLPVDLVTFNELIKVATFYPDTLDTKIKQVQSLLMDMQLMGVEPDLATFNNVLYSLSRVSMSKEARGLVLKTLNEMKSLGIEPSLASWKHVLAVFYPNEMADSNILYKIVEYLEGRDLTLRSPQDLDFFAHAMKRCCQNLNDVELALRIDHIVNSNQNNFFLGDNRACNIYYSFLLQTVCTFETLDKIMEVYQRVTPHVWTPGFAVLGELMKAMELQDGYHHLPLLWTDFLLFNVLRNEEYLEKLLGLMAKKKQEPELQAQYCHVAGQMLERWTDEVTQRQTGSTAAMVGHLLTIAENSDDHDLAWSIFQIYATNRNAFSGLPGDKGMTMLAQGCLDRGNCEDAVKVATVMSLAEMTGTGEVTLMILDSDKITLTSSQRDVLSSL